MISRVRRRGFVLVEVLVVITALSLAMGFGAMLLLAALRVDQLNASTLHRIRRNTELADFFREDVGRAQEAPASFDDFKAGPHCLILKHHADTHVIYHWDNNRLERIVRVGGRDARRPIAVGPNGAGIVFVLPPTDKTMILLRVMEPPHRKPPCAVEIMAAIGGDLR